MSQQIIKLKIGKVYSRMESFLFMVFIVFGTIAKAQVKSEKMKADIKVFSIDNEILTINKEKILADDRYLAYSFKKLYSSAEKALKKGPFTVTSKQVDPPSGDRHDYMSLAPYWWPDKTKSDGLPYVRRDGVVNPEVKNYPDKDAIVALAKSVYVLSLTYYLTGEERFAKHAISLLQVWFLDDET